MSWQKLQDNSGYKKNIETRSLIIRKIREFFWFRDFIEVETPILSHTTGQEPYLHPFSTKVIDGKGNEYTGYLQTSPEYAMKKMLAGGFSKIFQICKAFRNRENFGGLHNPEFTMIEWYRCDADYIKLMNDVEELVTYLCEILSVSALKWEHITMRELWKKYLNVDLDDFLSRETMIEFSRVLGYPTKDNETYEDAFFRIFLNNIENNITSPTMIYDYPAQMASLSRLKNDDSRYAERVEMYLGGMEIANGFSELVDSDEQLKRLKGEHELRFKLGHDTFNIDDDFILALRAGIPDSAGIALGIDRLVMALIGIKNIEDVLVFPAKEIF